MCNTGVSWTPLAEGKVHHFEARGLYNGVALLWDRESGSLWDHITGRSVYGPLTGVQMPTYNLLHTTVGAALEAHPALEVAISDRPVRRRRRMAGLAKRIPGLSPRFRRTMVGEDTRRPTMEIGLGSWTEEARRYYPMQEIRDAAGAIIDRLGGRGVVVYVDPVSQAAGAFHTESVAAAWDGETLRLDGGITYRGGRLRSAAGEALDILRPMQLFTRWYGFALTFPDTEIYAPSGR